MIFHKSDYDILLFKILWWFMITPKVLNLYQAKDPTSSGLHSPLQFYSLFGSLSANILLPYGLSFNFLSFRTYENCTCYRICAPLSPLPAIFFLFVFELLLPIFLVSARIHLLVEASSHLIQWYFPSLAFLHHSLFVTLKVCEVILSVHILLSVLLN